MTTRPAPVSPFALRAAGPFAAGGAALITLGALTWATDTWALRIMGVVAILLGGYLLLVSIGMFRLRSDQQRRQAELDLDQAVLSTAAGIKDGCADDQACVTCDTVCALRH